MSFKIQLFCFVRRNFIVKYRNKLQFISELLFPLTLLLLLIILHYMFSPIYHKESFSLVEKFPSYHTKNEPLNLFIIPYNNQTKKIVEFLDNELRIENVKYSFTYKEMKEMYVRERKLSKKDVQSFGLEFSDKNFPFDYTIYKEWSEDLFYKDNVNLFGESFQCNKSSTDIFNLYKNCAGNKYVYDGLSAIKYYTDLAIKKVI